MARINKTLVKEIAEDHNISANYLENLLKEADKLSYEKTIPNERIHAYYQLVKFAVSNSKSGD